MSTKLTAIRHRLVLPILGFSTLQLAACFPRQMPATPAVETKVVDASTGHPIQDALVVAWSDDSPDRTSSAMTNSDGFVKLATQQRTIWMPPIPFDFAYPAGHVRFSAAGYQSLELGAGEVTMKYRRSGQPVALTADPMK